MDGIACFFVIGLVCVAIIVFRAMSRADKQRAVDEAYTKYQIALGSLKSEPHRSDLRQRALDAGRRYSSIARENGAATLYDEVAIMNDIQAATGSSVAAPPVQPTASNPTPTRTSPTIEERLKSLEALRSKGVITEEEYASRRAALINEL